MITFVQVSTPVLAARLNGPYGDLTTLVAPLPTVRVPEIEAVLLTVMAPVEVRPASKVIRLVILPPEMVRSSVTTVAVESESRVSEPAASEMNEPPILR